MTRKLLLRLWHLLRRCGVLMNMWEGAEIAGQRFSFRQHLTFRIDSIAKSDYLSLKAAGFYNSANRIGLPKFLPREWAGVFQCDLAPSKSALSDYSGFFLGALNEESRRCFRVGRCHRHRILSACCAGAG